MIDFSGNENGVERERYLVLLPGYINKTLSAADRLWVKDYLERNAYAHFDLAFDKKLHNEISNTINEIAPSIGLNRLIKKIETDNTGVAVDIFSWKKFSHWLFAIPAWQVAWVMASVVIVQSLFLVNALRPFSSAAPVEYRSLPGQVSARVVVQFETDATIDNIRTLLANHSAEIVAGPSQFGEYWLMSETESTNDLMKALRDSTLVISVSASDQ